MQIKNLGENLSDKSACEKILISLSPKYNGIAMIIKEIKDLFTLSVHNLMGSLEMHEQRMSRNSEQSFKSIFQIKVNVKSGNQNASNGNASHDGYGGSRDRDNFDRGCDRNNNHDGGGNNQCGEVKIYHYCKISSHI
jgi:hypothetical protein